jgi:hypothetical protein
MKEEALTQNKNINYLFVISIIESIQIYEEKKREMRLINI